MRTILALLLAGLSAPAVAASPVDQPSRLPAPWQAKMRNVLKAAIETPSVVQRGQVPKVAELVEAQLRAAGFAASEMEIIPYEGLPGDKTAAFLFRWKAERPTAKPMMIIGHMDVVEAKREDWKVDPFQFIEKDGYFYGRGTSDMKTGIVATTLALAKLKAEGFKPKRDIILFFTGDEETQQNGALLGSTKWKDRLNAEFALNADGGGGAFDASGRPLGFALDAAEKTYQTYFFTVHNRGGHSSRPRPDNAIYELADALKKLQAHRFEPKLNDVTRAYFQARQQDETGALGDAMRRWLANPQDGEAADLIEANELEVGKTRTRCVATMLNAGHADNALPQMARATVNCRILPGVQPTTIQAELQKLVGPGVEITPDPSFIGQPTPVPAIRPDVLAAYTHAVQALQGKGMRVIPNMATGTSDASFFRSAEIPTYGVDGGWGISPDDERAHGLDERIPVRAAYDDLLHWETMIKELAGR
jgi:acetylornithine deacetylase/succinyl-diaminopimelate desuccinylase-like protein